MAVSEHSLQCECVFTDASATLYNKEGRSIKPQLFFCLTIDVSSSTQKPFGMVKPRLHFSAFHLTQPIQYTLSYSLLCCCLSNVFLVYIRKL